MTKSFVSIEKQVCLVTGEVFETNSLLMDMRLKNSLERSTVTGWGISPAIQLKLNEGYIAFVVIDESKSKKTSGGTIKPEDAYRLGKYFLMKRTVAEQLLSIDNFKDVNFCGEDFLTAIQLLIHPNDEHDE